MSQTNDEDRRLSKIWITCLVMASIAAVTVVMTFLLQSRARTQELKKHVSLLLVDPAVLDGVADGKIAVEAAPALANDSALSDNARWLALPLEQQAIVRMRWDRFQSLSAERRAALWAAYERLAGAGK